MTVEFAMSWRHGPTASKDFMILGMRVHVSISHGPEQVSDDIVPLAEEIDKRISAIGHRMDPYGVKLQTVLFSALAENKALNENMSAVQGRSSELIQAARAMRQRLIELGDPDPGLP